jgi:hypothetical protein
LRGHTGLIEHVTTSNDPRWHHLPVNGLAANIRDRSDGIFINPQKLTLWSDTGNFEFPSTQSVTIQLTHPPSTNVRVRLHGMIESSVGYPLLTVVNSDLIFTASNWDVPQQSLITMLPWNSTITGVGDTMVSYVLVTLSSNDISYRDLILPSIPVTLIDATNMPLLYTPLRGWGRESVILEGNTGSDDLVWIQPGELKLGINRKWSLSQLGISNSSRLIYPLHPRSSRDFESG